MKGAHIAYTADELLFVAARRDMPRNELRAAFAHRFGRLDVEVRHLRALCTRNGWTTGRERYSSAEDALIRARFSDTPSAHLAAEMGRTLASVVHRARALGIVKSQAYLASASSGRMQRGAQIGAATQFKKGQTPQNKGVKRPKGWAPGRMIETQYKPECKPRNWRPVGSTRVVQGYEYTKVGEQLKVSWTKNWKQTHVLQWEAVHGPVPAGHALKSVDGNSRNTDLANWQLIPRAILPTLNGGRHKRLGYDQAPADLRPVLLTLATLAHTMSKRKRAGSVRA
jgi:hypothetical protein